MELIRLLPFEQQRQVVSSQGNPEFLAATELLLYFGYYIPDAAEEIQQASLRNALAVLRRFYREKGECEQYRKELTAAALSKSSAKQQDLSRSQTQLDQMFSVIQSQIDDTSKSRAERKGLMEELEKNSISIAQQVLSPSVMNSVSKYQHSIIVSYYEALKEEAKLLKKQADNDKKELQKAYQEVRQSETQIEELKIALEQCYRDMLEEKAGMSHYIGYLQQEIKFGREKSDNRINELQESLKMAREEAKTRQNELEEQTNYLEDLKKENQKTCYDLTYLQSEFSDLETKLAERTAYLNKAATELRYKTSLLENTEIELMYCKQKLNEEQERCYRGDSAREKLEGEVKDFHESVIKLLAEKSEQTSSIKKLIYEYDRQKKEDGSKISELGIELKGLRDIEQRLIEERNYLVAYVATAKESEDLLVKTNEAVDNQLRECKKKYKKLYHELSDQKDELAYQKSEAYSLSAYKTELESRLNAIMRKETETLSRVQQLYQAQVNDYTRISKLEQQLADCIKRRDSLESESAAATRSNEYLQEKYRQAIKIFECMMRSAFEQSEPPRDVQEWVEMIKSYEATPDFKNELLKVTREREAAQQEKRDLKTKLDKYRENNEMMARTLDKLKSDMNVCKREKSEVDCNLHNCSLALQSLEDSFEHLRASQKDEHDSRIATLDSSFRGLEQQIGDLNREITEKEGRTTVLKRRLQRAKLALFNMQESNQRLLDGVSRLRNEQNARDIDSLVAQYDESSALDCSGSSDDECSHEGRTASSREVISRSARETAALARQKTELYAKIQRLEASLAAQKRLTDSGSRENLLEISRLRYENERLYLQASMAQAGAQPQPAKPAKPTRPARSFASAYAAEPGADSSASVALKSQVQALKEQQNDLERRLASAATTVRERDETVKKLQVEIERLEAVQARTEDELKKKVVQMDLERQSTQMEHDLDIIIQNNNSLLSSGPITVRSPAPRPLSSEVESDLIRQNAELKAQLERLRAKGDYALVERVRELEEMCAVSQMVGDVQERLKRDKKMQELEMTIKRLKQDKYPNIDEMLLTIQDAHQVLNDYVEYDQSLAARIYKMISKLSAERDRQINTSPYKRLIPELRAMFLQNVITAYKFGEKVDDALLKEMSQLYARYFDQLQHLFVDTNMDFSSTVREMKVVQAELSRALVD